MGSRVDHPSHYGGKDNIYEVIKIIDAWRCNFNTGNALKYMIRAGRKKSVDAVDKRKEDLSKARWYLQNQLERLHRECDTALVRQRRVAGEYAIEHVMAGTRVDSALLDAFAACYNQCSTAVVRRGIDALDLYMKGLK